jgi:hypothetical protein
MQVMTPFRHHRMPTSTDARYAPLLAGRRRLLTAALATVAGLALAAAAPAATIREVGLTSSAFPAPGCPSQCSVIARVTGYQAQSGSARNPYVVPVNGRIVAFTVALGSPDANQLKYFTQNFGGKPEIRLAVLKPVPHHRYLRLAAESELFDLTNYLGSTPTFALASSLRVSAGSVIALTTPTWAPAFAINRPTTDAWRSFRTNCNNNRQTAIHEGVGSVHTYNCLYRRARLLYSATLIPNPKSTKPAPTRGHTTTTHH